MITVVNKTNSPYDLRGVSLPAKGTASHDGWPDDYVEQLRAVRHLYDVHDDDAPRKRGRPRKAK